MNEFADIYYIMTIAYHRDSRIGSGFKRRTLTPNGPLRSAYAQLLAKETDDQFPVVSL